GGSSSGRSCAGRRASRLPDQTCALPAKLAARPVSTAGRVEPALAQLPLRHASIIPGKRAVGEDLVVLVSLPREQHDVAGAGLVEGQADGLLAVRLDEVPPVALLQSHYDVPDDLEGILLARVVV